MGFFVGWKYFEEKDRYSHEARQERERQRQDKENKRKKELKKEQRRKQKKAEQKKKLQEEWRAEAASYQSDQFGLKTDPYKSGYINEDGEEYKEAITKKYGLASGDPGLKQDALKRGMAGTGARMKKFDGPSPFDPKNKGPAGMNALGMENHAAIQDGQNKGSGFNKKSGMGTSTVNPMSGGLGRTKRSNDSSSQGNFSGKLNRPI